MNDEIERIMASLDITHEEINAQHADGHACEGGWVYTDAGDAIRCPTCRSNAHAARVTSEIESSGIGKRYLETEWSTVDMVDPFPALKAASDRIETILNAGDHLLLSGPPGCGKTQAAVLLIKATIAARRSARFMNLGRASMEIRSAYRDENGPTEADAVRRGSWPDLLVIDDLGAGETGNAAVEQRLLYLILEERQNTERSTVITTNLTPKEIADRLGARLFGRLQPLEVMRFTHGRNFRRPRKEGTAWTQS